MHVSNRVWRFERESLRKSEPGDAAAVPDPLCRRHAVISGSVYIVLMTMAEHPSRIHMRRRAHWRYGAWMIWECFKSSHI
jgi:hypothetical protein